MSSDSEVKIFSEELPINTFWIFIRGSFGI